MVGSMTFNMKALKIVIAGVLVAAALLLVFGIPVNFLVNSVQSRIESETGYHVTIDGGAKIGLRPSPTVWLRNITLLGRPGTAAQSQYKIGSVRVALSFFAVGGVARILAAPVTSRTAPTGASRFWRSTTYTTWHSAVPTTRPR